MNKGDRERGGRGNGEEGKRYRERTRETKREGEIKK